MKKFVPVVRFLIILMVLVIMGVLSAAYYQQHFKHERPCPLCILQRLGMIGVATGLLMNLRFGIQIRYYAFSLLSAFLGGAIALRQICLHICPGFPVFGIPVFGLNLFTWSFIVFAASILGIIVLMFLYSPNQNKKHPMNWIEKFAFFVVVLLTLSNFFTTFQECGLGPCVDLPWPQPKISTQAG